jgi:integrase
LGEVEGVGKRRKGKPQLRIDEARKWRAKALELASGGESGAVAALMCLLMGLRTSEVVERVVRDVDDDGRLLWVPEAKTEAGRRTQEIPEELQPFLLQLCEGKSPEDRLLGRHWRDWPCKWTRRICRLAGVPEVSAHGMRGLHATLAEEQGATAQMVVKALGHESIKTTHGHYTQPSAVANARQKRTLTVIGGGRRG